MSGSLPRSTGHVQHSLAVVLAQEIDQKVAVVVCARSLIANEHLPHFGGLSVGILVTYALGGDARRTGLDRVTLRHRTELDECQL